MITYGSTTLTSYNTITKIEVYYYKSTSATSLSGGSWSTTKPTWENGKYIWQKIRTTYEGKLENGQFYSESDPVNITGQQGATGTAAYSYKLNASDTSITVSKNGTYSKTSVTFSATSKQGTGTVNAYAGWFKIETTANGTTWTTQYTSSTNESSKEYTIPTGILNIRCSLYQAGGTSVLLDIVSVAIVKDGADGALYPNLTPFFSHDITDIYDVENNPNGYWMDNGTSYGWTKNSKFTFTQLEDGWLHVHIDNSSGTSTIRNDCCVPKYNPSIKRATKYTFLAEFRNNQSTGVASGSDFYLVQQSGSVQFWGQDVTTAPLTHLEGIGTTTVPISSVPSDGSYAFSRFTKFSESDGESSHWTTNDKMVTFVFRANAGAVLDYDVRLSVYEGEYWGNYVPYIISDVTDIRNSAEMANNKIDNLEIGGRNLLRTEPKKYVPTDYSAYEFTLTEPLEANQTYTIQLWNVDVSHSAKTEDQLGISVYYCGSSVNLGTWQGTNYFTNGHADHLILTFTPTEDNINHSNVVNATTKFIKLYNSYPNTSGTRNMSIEKWQLEKGTKATDWSPAPEDTQADIDTALAQSVEYIVGTQTATTGTWTGKTVDKELKVGKTIAYKLPYSGSGNASLVLTLADNTTTNAIAVYLNTTRVTTHFGAGSVINMTYDGQYWRASSIPNSNTVGVYGGAFTAGTNGVRGYSLIMKDTQNTMVSITTSAGSNSTNAGNGTNHAKYTGGLYFDTVMYEGSNANYASGASIGTCYTALAIDLRYSTNCGSTLIKGRDVYLVGTIINGLFYLDNTWWTQTLPASQNDKVYIYLGSAYSTTSIYLVENNPAYMYYEGKFLTLKEIETEKAKKTATNYMSSDNTGIMVADLADGEQLPANATGKNVFITAGYGSGDVAVNAGVHIRNGQEDLAFFGETAQIGKSDQGHIILDNDSADIKNNNDVIASFGQTTIIGKEGANNLRTKIAGGSFQIIDDDNSAIVNIGKVRATASQAQKIHFSFGTRDNAPYGNYSFVQGTSNAAVFNDQVALGRYGKYGALLTFMPTISSANPTFTQDISTYLSRGFTKEDIEITIPNYSGNYTWDLNNGIITVTFLKEEQTQWSMVATIKIYIGEYVALMIGNGSENNRSNAVEMLWDGNIKMALDTNADEGTTDKNLYTAITTLGWENDVVTT